MKTSYRTRLARIFLALAMVMNLIPSAAFPEITFADPVTIADTSAIYVSSAGDDTNGDGSQASPYATITKAYTAAATGDTICLLSDLDVSTQITFGTDKTVTITSADSSNVKTVYSKIQFGYDNKTMITVAAGEVIFKNITIDGTGQRQAAKSGFPDGVANSPCCIYAIKSGATATLDAGTTIQNFWKNNGTSGGSSVLKATVSGSRINIKDGVLITKCVLEAGNTDDPSSVLSSGTGATMCMTGGTVTGNTLSTTQSASTAIVNIGKMNNPHFWMTSGKITGNTINSGCAAVYMRGEANACDIQFGDTAYVYDNYVNGTSGDQKNIYLKNDNNGSENDNVFVKLCSALTGDAKLGVYAEIIGIGTKVAQGTKESGTKEIYTPTGSTYTATIADTAYFVSDKATTAEILYCGGSEDTCGLLAHSTASPDHEKAIYLSTSPSVSASKGTEKNTIDATISRCASDATYVVLDKDLKPVTGKTLDGGAYETDGNGTFKLTDSTTTTTIGMQGLPKDSGPYTVMLVRTDGLTVDSTTGKADTSNLTDIATINAVNFAGENVSWSDGTTTFENGDFDIVTVPHNDQTGIADKTYTATPSSGYSFVETNPIVASGNLGKATITDKTGSKTVALEAPAYGTTSKGTSGYSTVTLTGSVEFDLEGVSLLEKTGGNTMTSGKTYDSVAVDHTTITLPSGLSATYIWQKKNSEGEYEDISGNAAPSDVGSYNLKVVATRTSDSSVAGAQDLPFTISKRELTITGASVTQKKYDGTDTATVTSVNFDGLQNGDTLAANTDYIVSNAKYDGVNATGVGAATKVNFDVALTNTTLANNYTLKSTTGTQDAQTIEKADTVNKTASTIGTRGQENTFDMPDGFMVEGANIASITVTKDDNSILAHEPKYADNKLTYELNSYAENGQSAVTQLKISSQNYDFYFIDITIGVDEKQEVAITIDEAAFTYNATPQAPTSINVENELVPTSDLVVTYVGTGSTNYPESSTAPTDAGTYSMTVSVPDSNNKYKGSATKSFTIAPKEITATLSAENKTYDGNTTATATATLTGVEDADKDDVEITVAGAAFSSKDAADNKQVSATVSLSGTAAKNYTLSANTVNATANIEKKTLAIKNLSVADKFYDGTTAATINTTLTLKGVVEGDAVTLTNGTPTFASAEAAQNVAVSFTDFQISGADAANYTLTQPTGITANINAYTAVKGSDYSVNSNNWLNGDFVITPKEGWQVSYHKKANGEWLDTIVISEETNNGVVRFYLKNKETGAISEEVIETYMIDKTAPVMSGAVDGKTYCAAVTLTISDENLDTVTVNGENVEIAESKLASTDENIDTAKLSSDAATMTDGKLTLGPAEGEQTVVATDKAGNSSNITVTVNEDHAWGAWTSDGDGEHHTRICQIDSAHVETEECHGGVATCADKAVCEVCKGSYGELDPQNHVELKHLEAVAATTDAEGNIEYWYCKSCDKYYSDANATQEISNADTVLAKLGNASTEETSASTEDDNVAKTSASTEDEGTTKTLAKTGDENTALLCMALLLASSSAATAITVVNRKKKHNK